MNNLAYRYDLASRKLWNELPAWKREAIEEDRAAGKDSRLIQELAQAVIELAEGNTKLVEQPYYDYSKKSLTPAKK